MLETFRIVDPLKPTAFLDSAMQLDGPSTRPSFLEWFSSRRAAHQFEVARIPFAQLKNWFFEPETGNLAHQSGKFFKIEGCEIKTNFGPTKHWMQPIINQPEIGILGFLTKKIDGVLHFLVQAKMEPGNINLLQLSPTVQATRSNYTQVHGGLRPLYLDYFLDRNRAQALVDQIQSEQGARFWRKRNRNMIVEVRADEPVEVHPDFCWLTLGQIIDLLALDNIVNMDSRTVLSCIRYAGATVCSSFANAPGLPETSFRREVLDSAMADLEAAWNNFDSLIRWITYLKTHFEFQVGLVPLNQVKGWRRDDAELRHESGRFFSVIGVSVTASSREVHSWQQPLIESAKGGLLCFVCQKKENVLHFLVQGRVEPGNFDGVELAPTLQCTPANYDRDRPEHFPPFYELIVNAKPEQVRYSSLQSEEGGRFYHDENRYLIIEIEPDMELDLPENYNWMTLRQMKEFIRFNNFFNIEARGLVSCLG
jgi:oxidase EvaA